MGEAQELQLHIMTPDQAKENNTTDNTNQLQTTISDKKINRYKKWLKIALYTTFILSGQSVALLLGRLYFDKGGKSKWVGTVVQLIGFPLLLPYYFITKPKIPTPQNQQYPNSNHDQSSSLKLALVYFSLGLLVAADCFLYSVGLMYLPVSTYSLISASQLAFNSLFSFFLNSQKFTPYIVNSLVLLTISSTLLIFQPESEVSNKVSKGKYVIGFICTIAASAGYGLVLSLTQLAFKKVVKNTTFKAIIDMVVYQALVASFVALVGLFASGEWEWMKREMNEFELGKVSYVMTLVWTAVFWEVFSIGCVGLIFDISSLFSNAVSVVGLPIVPVFAVVFFHDKMSGVKGISMVLAVWGFISYVYQHYIDDFESRGEKTSGNIANGVSEILASSHIEDYKEETRKL